MGGYLGEGDKKASDGGDNDDADQPEGDMLRPKTDLKHSTEIHTQKLGHVDTLLRVLSDLLIDWPVLT